MRTWLPACLLICLRRGRQPGLLLSWWWIAFVLALLAWQGYLLSGWWAPPDLCLERAYPLNYTVTHWHSPSHTYTQAHTHKGKVPCELALSPCQGQVGDIPWYWVTWKGGNHIPERLTPLSPWVSAAHVSQVSLNQVSVYTAAGGIVCVKFECEREREKGSVCNVVWVCVQVFRDILNLLSSESMWLINQSSLILWSAAALKIHCHNPPSSKQIIQWCVEISTTERVGMIAQQKLLYVFNPNVYHVHTHTHPPWWLTRRAWGLRW